MEQQADLPGLLGHDEAVELSESCDSCPDPTVEGSEGEPEDECPYSRRSCGHHCNHSWSHDHCHWCDTEFGEDGA